MIYTTLKKIEACNPCDDRLQVLLDALPHRNRSKKIPLDFILDNNGFDDTMWLFENNCDIGNNDIFIRKFAVWCAWQCLDNYEKKYPDCRKVRDCLECVERFIDGKATTDELSAARLAVWSAARSAARSTTDELSATLAAVWSAAPAAVWSAAWSAARSAARSAQTDKLSEMLQEHE